MQPLQSGSQLPATGPEDWLQWLAADGSLSPAGLGSSLGTPKVKPRATAGDAGLPLQQPLLGRFGRQLRAQAAAAGLPALDDELAHRGVELHRVVAVVAGEAE